MTEPRRTITLINPPRRFFFIRHGQTENNVDRLISGQADIPLTKLGLAQAAGAAETLRGEFFTALVCSPLKRALDTARIIGTATGHEPVPNADLMERRWGVFTGQPSGTVRAESNPEGGEPFDAYLERISRGFNAAFALGEVAIVGHAGTFRELRFALGVEMNEKRVPNASPILFEHGVDGSWRMLIAG